jgi:hypothetical protein
MLSPSVIVRTAAALPGTLPPTSSQINPANDLTARPFDRSTTQLAS